MATDQDVDLADTWLQGQSKEGLSDPLSDPFAILTDHHKRQKMNTSGYSSDNKDIPISVSEGDKLHEVRSPTSQPMNQSVANSFFYSQSKSNNGRAGVQIDTYNSNPCSDPSSHYFDTKSLTIPKSLNPHENVLRRSARLRESQEKEELQKCKVHTTYGTAAAIKLDFGVFSLFDLASSIIVPKHRTNANAAFTEQVMNQFHEF